MVPLVERVCHHWMLPLVDRNVHQVGMLPLVERYFHHWMLHFVEINVHQDLPIVEGGYQGIPLIESDDQGTMDPSKNI